MKTSSIILWCILGFILLVPACIFIKGCSVATRMVNNGLETTYQQFKPEELLRKYEWFKDASAQLDNKVATLSDYEGRFHNLKQSYGSDSGSRRQWSRSDIEQWNIWQSEYTGLQASYNDLSAQYNSTMAKFNYRFCNVGMLPQGQTEPLPREFKPYITR